MKKGYLRSIRRPNNAVRVITITLLSLLLYQLACYCENVNQNISLYSHTVATNHNLLRISRVLTLELFCSSIFSWLQFMNPVIYGRETLH